MHLVMLWRITIVIVMLIKLFHIKFLPLVVSSKAKEDLEDFLEGGA